MHRNTRHEKRSDFLAEDQEEARLLKKGKLLQHLKLAKKLQRLYGGNKLAFEVGEAIQSAASKANESYEDAELGYFFFKAAGLGADERVDGK
jgi:hypothetical protein